MFFEQRSGEEKNRGIGKKYGRGQGDELNDIGLRFAISNTIKDEIPIMAKRQDRQKKIKQKAGTPSGQRNYYSGNYKHAPELLFFRGWQHGKIYT